MATTLTFTSAPFIQGTVFTSADTTVSKTILTADAVYARRVYGISIWTDESVARDVALHLSDGTNNWEITTLAIPINAGNTNAILPVDVFTNTQMAPIVKQRDASGALYLNIPIGWSIRVAYNVTMSPSKFSNFTVIGETYA